MVDLFYYAEPLKIYANLSIAMITLSFAILSLLIPYLRSSLSKILFEKLNLEKIKRQLTAQEIYKKYNQNEEEIGNINFLRNSLFMNIIIFSIILFFSTYALVFGTYHCLAIPTCRENNTPIWAINQNDTILNIKISTIYSLFPLLSLIGFIILFIVIINIYNILKRTIYEEAQKEADKLKERISRKKSKI